MNWGIKMKKNKRKFFEEIDPNNTKTDTPPTNAKADLENIEKERINNFLSNRKEMLLLEFKAFQNEISVKYRNDFNNKVNVFKKIKEVIELIK